MDFGPESLAGLTVTSNNNNHGD
ncbi:hypothetical protein PUN4_280222 [Paraburkholderia unamae]|nr:hypothetical protein PUN4_280222 [Paraburkholderia unamae]